MRIIWPMSRRRMITIIWSFANPERISFGVNTPKMPIMSTLYKG
ncbi:MAG TPA: hypothetical protein PK785_05085 [Bacteroidales bacterium]|nr:hypothetical protein [Bacteroidales bacterium]